MDRWLMIAAAAALAAGALGGFRLGVRHHHARTRHAGWRASVRAVPLAFRAFTDALLQALTAWAITLGVAALVLWLCWEAWT